LTKSLDLQHRTMAELIEGSSQHTTGGFHGAPVTKFVTGASIVGHVALHVPMFASMKSALHCNLTRVFESGQLWRLVTSKLVFLDTKDAIFCLILLYQFRVFERRYGSRNFTSHIIATSVITALAEILLTQAYSSLSGNSHHLPITSFAIGPFGAILPLFVNYFFEIPSLSNLNMFSISSKSMFYLIGGQVALSSTNHSIVFVASLLAGLWMRNNLFMVKKWIRVPVLLASLTDRLFGWMVRSGEPSSKSELLGATLEIQRTQAAELMEQRMMRQQQVLFEERNRRMNRVGQGFQEQLVNNQFFPQRPGDRAVPPILRRGPEPSEENIQMLVDMGFDRGRVMQALRQTGNDVQSATAVLLHGREQPLR